MRIERLSSRIHDQAAGYPRLQPWEECRLPPFQNDSCIRPTDVTALVCFLNQDAARGYAIGRRYYWCSHAHGMRNEISS